MKPVSTASSLSQTRRHRGTSGIGLAIAEYAVPPELVSPRAKTPTTWLVS